MNAPRDWLLVPVKAFSQAKTRLAPVLTPVMRALLATAMLEDVLAAATDVCELCDIAIVTNSPDVAWFVAGRCTTVIDDRGAIGTNAAVTIALAELAVREARTVVILPSDIPLIRGRDIAELIAAAKRCGVALAPATYDNGTNGFALKSPTLISPHFGPNSFTRHLAAACAAGINSAKVTNSRLGLDLDDPLRLREFRSMQSDTQSERLLLRFDTRICGEAFENGALASGCARDLHDHEPEIARMLVRDLDAEC